MKQMHVKNTVKLLSVIVCTMLGSIAPCSTNCLATGETFASGTSERPEITMLENPAEAGGVLSINENEWVLSDTSKGSIGNRGTSFAIKYDSRASIVSQINEVLAKPAGTEPVDFLVGASMQRFSSAGRRLVSVSFSGMYEGARRPSHLFPKHIEFKENAVYTKGGVFNLEDVTPRTRFRVWPSGGANSINGLTFRIGIRVDTDAEPETLRIENFRILRISKEGVEDSKSAKVILCTEGMAPPVFIDTWRKLGIRVRTGLTPGDGEKVVGVYADTFALNENEARTISEYIHQGAALIISAGTFGGEPPEAIRKILPVNTWSFKNPLRRYACTVTPVPDSGIKINPVPFSGRFDMHIPGSAVESPLVRYRPEQYLRDKRTFSRTSVVMECDADGCLPFLIDSDVGNSRVLVCASGFEDATAYASPEYQNWGRYVAGLPFGSKLPDHSLPVEPLNARFIKEASLPFAIAIEEDEETLEELSQSPYPREGIDGITSYRYIYRTGTSPKIKLRIRNHFNNIAPLAAAKDKVWPENSSASGLNDMSFTHSSVRGKLPLHAVWCGKQSEEQRVALEWRKPVVIGGMRLTGGGQHRFWFRNNPRDFSVIADNNVVLSVTNALFIDTSSQERAIFESMFDYTRKGVSSLELAIHNLNPKVNQEPRRDWPSNCSITEWEVWGWAGGAVNEKTRQLQIEVEEKDLLTGIKTSRALATVSSTPFSEKIVSTSLDTRHKFGPVRYIFRAKDGKVVLAEKEFDVFYVPAEGNKLVRKIQDGCVTVGALCTPGWRQQDSFGLGMNKWTEGWGGPHDQTWAFTQDLLEMGTRNVDSPERMLTSATRASHYTNPWRRFLNGMYSWDWFKEKLEKRLVSGDWSRQNVAKVHVFGSDRWNGIPVGSCFGWDVFVDFDKWLRANGEQGLKAKSRKEVVREISEEYGDKWQVFNLERYADKMLKTQDSIRKLGYDFTFETHGSFPMAGGELGRKLAKTHIGVGTDLFWELRRQDMWWSLGGRIAIVAANPDLRSGAYDEWGWINSEQNEFWFGANSEPGVARRQWYATYFLGRVTLDGEFLPYHETGFSSQGGHGIRYDANDHFWRTRVHNLITQIRPEKASGFGMVVSWQGQERRMGPKLGRQGFGLFPEDGEDDIESLCEKVYVPLVKQGLPISFVTSTHALKNWKGKNPLVLVDAVNWEDWEIEEVKRLQKNGATVISIGKQHPKLANIKAAEFFARERSADKKQGGIISWEGNLDQLNGITARHLCSRIMDALGNPLSTSRGLAVVPFVSNDHLFLAVNRQGDDSTPATVTVKPEFFHSKTKVSNVVSLDDGTILPTTQLDSGTVRVEFPLEDASGKVLMFGKAE